MDPDIKYIFIFLLFTFSSDIDKSIDWTIGQDKPEKKPIRSLKKIYKLTSGIMYNKEVRDKEMNEIIVSFLALSELISKILPDRIEANPLPSINAIVKKANRRKDSFICWV